MSMPPCIRHAIVLIAVLLMTATRAAAEADTDDGTPPPDRWAGARDPFWPVGYTPPPPLDAEAENAQQEVLEEQLQWPELRVTGLTRTGEGWHLAIIEGVGIVESGETIQIEREGIVYRWRVDAITARGISVRELEARAARGDLHNAGQ